MTSPYIRNAAHVEREKSCGKRRRFCIARRQRQQDGVSSALRGSVDRIEIAAVAFESVANNEPD
jgi:hypothetical protein